MENHNNVSCCSLEEKDVVLSDIHVNSSPEDNCFSRFTIENISAVASLENLTSAKRRRKRKRNTTFNVNIKHAMETEVSRVGLQVWRASLLLMDYVLHESTFFRGCVALELGSGTGISLLY